MGERSSEDSTRELATVEIDIPLWLSLLVLISASLSLFLALALNSNPYLTSTTGYADGGDMYSHQVEVLYLKELLQNGTTDLWFDEVTLGYPFFLAYQPFPCLFTSSLMMLTERFISPLLLFRWMFLLLLSSMPWFWFIGLRKLGMNRLEATMAALCVHSICSWRKFGLELDAFQEYGIFTQAYGMAIFPLAVGFLYQYILYHNGSSNGTVLLIVLNFTSHMFFGIYLGVATVVTLLVDLFTNQLPLKRKVISPSIYRALYVHFVSIALLSWWIIPLLINFEFIGGLPWKNESEHGLHFEFVLRNILSGEMFDHGRKFPFITLGVLAGVSCICFTQLKGYDSEHCTERQTLFIWLMALFSVTFFLFLGRTFSGPLYDIIPFHKELEALRYLNGIHFCGLLLMAVSFSRILRLLCMSMCRISKAFFNSHVVLITFMLVFPPIYLSSQLQGLNSRLSVTEMKGFPEGLEVMKAYPNNGRVFASKALGSGGPWDLALLPHHSKKPGIVTYSRGYHDTLSLYYLEQLQPSLDTTPWFPDLLRLYNIRFLATSGIEISSHFLETCQLRHLASIDSLDVFVRASQEDYGYFEFAHVPGNVVGDLKGMREAVLTITQLFTYRVLFAINPSSELAQQSLFSIVVSDHHENASFIRRLLSPDEFETRWLVNKRPVREKAFFAHVEFGRDPEHVMSRVLEEEAGTNFYTADVEVAEETWSEDFYQTENLILKASYHPFWTCSFRSLAASHQAHDQTRAWHVIPVHHVTPNLMSVVLPPGRHHVTCEYKNPVYQKVGFFLFITVILALVVTELRRYLQCR